MNENKKATTAEELIATIAAVDIATSAKVSIKDQKAADMEIMSSTKVNDWENFCVNYALIGYSLPLTKKFLQSANVSLAYINSIQEYGEGLTACFLNYSAEKSKDDADAEQVKIKRSLCFDYAKRILKFFNISRNNYKLTAEFVDELGGKLYGFTYADKTNIRVGQTIKPVSGFKAVDTVIKMALTNAADREELATNVAKRIVDRRIREEKKCGELNRIVLPALETSKETEKQK